jgi:hypothetical protein
MAKVRFDADGERRLKLALAIADGNMELAKIAVDALLTDLGGNLPFEDDFSRKHIERHLMACVLGRIIGQKKPAKSSRGVHLRERRLLRRA